MFSINIHGGAASIITEPLHGHGYTVQIKPDENAYTEITFFVPNAEAAQELDAALRKMFTEPAPPTIEHSPTNTDEEVPF